MPRHLYNRILSPQFAISLSFDEVAQASHVAIAAAAVGLTSARFHGNSKYIAALLVGALAAVKEWFFDQRYEDPVTRGSNLEDWSYYVAGAVVALLILIGAN